MNFFKEDENWDLTGFIVVNPYSNEDLSFSD